MTWLTRWLKRSDSAPTSKTLRRLRFEPLEDRVVPTGRPLPIPVIFAGAGANSPPLVRAYEAETGKLNFEKQVYESAFTGGVRVANGDITRDGYPDLVVAAGPGGGPRLRVLDGRTGDTIPGPLGDFYAYEHGFSAGLNLAADDLSALRMAPKKLQIFLTEFSCRFAS